MRSKKTGWRAALALTLCVFLESCTRELTLEVSTVGREVSIRFKTSGLFKADKTSCVIVAAVYDTLAKREVWSFGPSVGECADLNSFVVGSVPRRFVAYHNEKLVSGRSYYATVISATENGKSDTWVQP